MLRDLTNFVRNLVGDSKVEKPSKKSMNPTRDALLAHGGREMGINFSTDLFTQDPWNMGFVVIILNTGRTWKLPGDRLFAMYRDYLKLAELQGGSSIKDIVEGLGCAIVIFSVDPTQPSVRVHINRRSTKLVLDPIRDLRSSLERFNKQEREEHAALNPVSQALRKPLSHAMRVTAYDGDRVFKNAMLR